MNNLIDATIIVVGSNSVHSQRYVDAISYYFRQIIFITNHSNNSVLPGNITVIPLNFKLTNLKVRLQIAKIIHSYPESIIHIHQANSYAYHTLKALKRVKSKHKTILTTWGSDVLLLPHKNLFFKHMVKFNLANSDAITSDSLFMSAKIKELCPQAKNIHTINFGMHNFPEHLDLTHKEDIILSSRLHKKLYNIDLIIHGFANLIDKCPQYANYRLIIAGSGDETENLQRLARTLNIEQKVEFVGMLSSKDLATLYAKAKLFLSIPNSDATSMSVLEAMGYGCYPILSNLPANLEWVLDDINGIICQNLPALHLDIELGIERIANNSVYKKVANFNYDLIRQKAMFEDNIQKFIQLYYSTN